MSMTISALEHRIPELFFTNEEHPGEAVSAVKALAVASAEGQRIYQITSANVGVVNSLNIGQEVKDEIIASVAVGKEATVSESNITVAGWTGVGYIISDPETRAGAYRISGGANGGFLALLTGISLGLQKMAMLVMLFTAITISFSAGTFLPLLVVLYYLLALLPLYIELLDNAENEVFTSDSERACLSTGAAIGSVLVLLITGIYTAIVKKSGDFAINSFLTVLFVGVIPQWENVKSCF